jgi:hypothetical protein
MARKNKEESDCRECERKDRRIEHLEKQLRKLKKQVMHTRQRLSELDYLSKEVEYISAQKTLEEAGHVVEEIEEEKKPVEYDDLSQYDTVSVRKPKRPLTPGKEWFNPRTGQMEPIPEELPDEEVGFRPTEKLSYSRSKESK